MRWLLAARLADQKGSMAAAIATIGVAIDHLHHIHAHFEIRPCPPLSGSRTRAYGGER